MNRYAFAWVLTFTLAFEAGAQVKIGDLAPLVEADALLNSPYGGIDALQGKLVLYVWFLPESSTSRKLARSLSPLLRKYRQEGLEVVAISHRELDQLENWVRRRKPAFIVAWEPSNISMGSYPFQQWPSSALVNARGRVVHKGTPGQVSEALIKKHLKGARGRGPDAPLRMALDLPPRLLRVSDALEEGRIGRAVTVLEATLARDPPQALRAAAVGALDRVKALLNGKLTEAADAVAARRYYEAQLFYERLRKHAPGTPQAEKAGRALSPFKKDAAIMREIRGGKLLHRAWRNLDLGKRKRALKQLATLTGSQWAGSAVRKRAEELLARLRRGGR